MPRTPRAQARLELYVAMRASPHGGSDWHDLRTADTTRDGCARRAQYIDSGDPIWSRDNPVVRIVLGHLTVPF
jgi:hypothetical protein